jgi:tellurium resistance protein TerZ
MRIGEEANALPPAGRKAMPCPKEVVMGLHWTPPEAGATGEPADLDALCVLFDEHKRVLEVVCPVHSRSSNGSVIHTGDSRTGASQWDDERIIVFLEALPEEISSIAFVVVSATDRGFSEVRGGTCHISDHVTEREYIRLQLTNLGQDTARCIATLQRSPIGWRLKADAEAIDAELMADLRSSMGSRKASAARLA